MMRHPRAAVVVVALVVMVPSPSGGAVVGWREGRRAGDIRSLATETTHTLPSSISNQTGKDGTSTRFSAELLARQADDRENALFPESEPTNELEPEPTLGYNSSFASSEVVEGEDAEFQQRSSDGSPAAAISGQELLLVLGQQQQSGGGNFMDPQDGGTVSSLNEDRVLLAVDRSRLEQLRGALKPNVASQNDHDVVLDALNLYGSFNQGPSSALNSGDYSDIKLEHPFLVDLRTGTQIITEQDAPPVADTRIILTPGLSTAFTNLFDGLAISFGNFVNTVGTELANNTPLAVMAVMLAAWFFFNLFVNSLDDYGGYGGHGGHGGNGLGGYGLGWSFGIPGFRTHKAKPKSVPHGGYHEDWKRHDNRGDLRINGELGDPYTEAESVHRLRHVVDEYKNRYGDHIVDGM